MSKSRDTQTLNARSLALSALLGTHPPRLPTSALVALAELFGINGGTMRTALSRMVGAGDVVVDDGNYSLTPRLIERQAAQDAGRRVPPEPTGVWDRTWHTAVPVVDQRDLADRRHVRTVMANARFGELRPTVWLRPANVAAPHLGADWLVTTGHITGADAADLVARLWDLATTAAAARDLLRRLDVAEEDTGRSDVNHIPAAFILSADIVRFLRSDPLLPDEFLPRDWPLGELRRRYDRFEHALQLALRPILRGETKLIQARPAPIDRQ